MKNDTDQLFLVSQTLKLHNRMRQQLFWVRATSPELAIERCSALDEEHPSTFAIEDRLLVGSVGRKAILRPDESCSDQPFFVGLFEWRVR